jgi:hypothetical protein
MDNEIKELADACAELDALVKQGSSRLKELKKELKKQMNLKNMRSFTGTNYKCSIRFFKNRFSPSLSKEFKNLNNETINEFIESGLVLMTSTYKLNVEEYQSTLEKNQATPIDQWVKERSGSAGSTLAIKQF